MKKIKINNIKIFGYHGLYESEKNDGQNFYVSFEYISSDIIDYSLISLKIVKYFNLIRYNYLEDLADNLLKLLFDDFDFLFIKLIIIKIDSPIIKLSNNKNIKVDDISVEIEKYRK